MSRQEIEQESDARRQRPLLILLAGGETIHQRLAVACIKSWGHRVIVAGNGEKALAAMEGGGLDLVLMEVRMPGMSGFEAATAIRRREQNTGTRVPIIALIAGVIDGHRDACLKAGMDECVAQPIQFKELLAAMLKVVPDLFLEPTKVGVASDGSSGLDFFDYDALLDSLDGNVELLREIAGLFADSDAARLGAALREAAVKRDPHAVESAAHALKGVLGELRAGRGAEMARQLEQGARSGDLTELDARAAALLAETDALKLRMRQLIET